MTNPSFQQEEAIAQAPPTPPRWHPALPFSTNQQKENKAMTNQKRHSPKQDPFNFWEWLKKQFQEAPGLMMMIAFVVIVVIAQIGGCFACDFNPAWWLPVE